MEQTSIPISDSNNSNIHFLSFQPSYGGARGDIPRLQWPAPPAEEARVQGPGHGDDRQLQPAWPTRPAQAQGSQYLCQKASQEAACTWALPG